MWKLYEKGKYEREEKNVVENVKIFEICHLLYILHMKVESQFTERGIYLVNCSICIKSYRQFWRKPDFRWTKDNL